MEHDPDAAEPEGAEPEGADARPSKARGEPGSSEPGVARPRGDSSVPPPSEHSDPARADTVTVDEGLTAPPKSWLGAGDVVGGRWRLDAFLASGGMGTVWRATDQRLQEVVAVKLMDPRLVRTSGARERFLQEAQAAAKLRGSHVVSVLDFDIDRSGVPYMAMELLRGEDLHHRLARGPLGYMQTCTVMRDVCTAMARAHRAGIVHRDLKPSNVFLVVEDDATTTKVLDFGIAKLILESDGGPRAKTTSQGRVLGTVGYMSPEQFSDSRDVDTRADLWSLGVIAFECLTGTHPFPGADVLETIALIGERPPVPSRISAVPKGFDAWFAKAVAKDRDQRFQTAKELCDALCELGAATAEPVVEPASERVPEDAPTSLPSQTWASDANQIDIEVLDDITFRNSVVEEFLDDSTKHFVAGAKGLGKTLLLTYKRSIISERYHGEGASRGQSAVQLIPEGRPYLDLMSDLRTPGKGHVDFMSSLSNCKRAWGFALRVCALSYQPSLLTEEDEEDLQGWPRRLRAVAKGTRFEPTMVLKELLGLGVGAINRLIDDAESFLEYKIRALHSGMYIFIDKVDQALRTLSREAWVYMQAGLVEAAWDLMSTNRHIKVFATIREEAFSSYESDIKANLFGATTTLRYSTGDLRRMLEKLTNFYEGLPLRDFVSPEVVAQHRDEDEEAFDFIFRHTLGRPRDLVIVSSEISRHRDSLDERQFKRVVRETSAGIVVSNVFDEMRVFLDVLHDKAQRLKFFSLLPYTVLTRDDAIGVWCQLHGVEREYFDTYGRHSPDVYHPFRELYDCGVLGVIEPDGERSVQRFKQPHDAIDGLHHELPRSPFYLLHPALHALIVRQGPGSPCRAIHHVVIGHDRPWPTHYGPLVQVQRALFRAVGDEQTEVEGLVMDLLAQFARHVAGGATTAQAREALGREAPLSQISGRLEERGWDELHVTLLDLFPERDR